MKGPRVTPSQYNRRHDVQDYGLRAEVRGVEENHRAWLNDDGSITVVSDNDPKVKYTVTFKTVGSLIHFKCTCPSGVHRYNHFVPCKHATRAARRLERHKLARWQHGQWYAVAESDDDGSASPLAGL